MNNKSFFKKYGVLLISITFCVVGLIVLGFSIFKSNKVLMKDFKGSNKSEIVAWVSKNKLEDYISYSYEYSLDIQDGEVISQSLKPNSVVDKEFTITISKGSIASLNTTDYPDKDSFDSFIKNYKNVNVTYEEVQNELAKGKIIVFSKETIDLKKDDVKVSISLGKDNEQKEENNKEEKEEEDNKVLIPDNMLGMEEDKFIKTLNDLGFKNLKKDSQKYYSFKSKKDTIFSYDDGNFLTSRTINYAISFGDYISSFNKSEYENKSLTDANNVVDKYNKLNAHIVLKTSNVKTSDDKLVGLLSSCSAKQDGSNSLITCSLYVKEDKTVNVSESYIGRSESEFLDYLKSLGLSKTVKDDSRYSNYPLNKLCKYDSGNKKLTDTIHYTLSLGTYTCNANDFEGKTVDAVNSFINPLNKKGANISFTYTNEPNDSKTKNTLYDCVANSNKVTCKLANNKDKYQFPNKSTLTQFYQGSSFDETKSLLESNYKSYFPNLKCVAVKSEITAGNIVDAKVNGNSDYKAGYYDFDTVIEITISSGLD